MSISRVNGNRVSNSWLFAVFLFLSTTTQSQADPFSDCTNRTDIDLRIKGCSQLIEQPTTGKKQLYLAYNLRGSAYAQRTEYDRAIADLTKAVELDPSDAIVFAARGEAFRRKGQADKAIGDFNTAIELDANQANAYHSRGLVYLVRKDYNRAIADLSTAIEINPGSAMAFHDRALIHEALGQREKAIDDFRAVLQIDPGHRSSQNGLKRLGVAAGSTAAGNDLCGRPRAEPTELFDALSRVEKLRELHRDRSYVALHDNAKATTWTFTVAGHLAHPSVVCRRIVQDAGQLKLEMKINCAAPETHCKKLLSDFRELNTRMMEEMKKTKQ